MKQERLCSRARGRGGDSGTVCMFPPPDRSAETRTHTHRDFYHSCTSLWHVWPYTHTLGSLYRFGFSKKIISTFVSISSRTAHIRVRPFGQVGRSHMSLSASDGRESSTSDWKAMATEQKVNTETKQTYVIQSIVKKQKQHKSTRIYIYNFKYIYIFIYIDLIYSPLARCIYTLYHI